jgi:hypothetical protein
MFSFYLRIIIHICPPLVFCTNFANNLVLLSKFHVSVHYPDSGFSHSKFSTPDSVAPPLTVHSLVFPLTLSCQDSYHIFHCAICYIWTDGHDKADSCSVAVL